MFGLPGGTEWIFIGLIALLLFGKRLPEVMRSLGKGITEFKRGMREVTDEMHKLTDVDVDEASSRPIEPPAPSVGESGENLIDEEFDDEGGDEYEDEDVDEAAEDEQTEGQEGGETARETTEDSTTDSPKNDGASATASPDAQDNAEDENA